MTYSPTHAELVVRASQWLRNNKCSVVITELNAGFEIPDAIGFEWHVTKIVECKISRQDFFADSNKMFRQNPFMGVGILRYYMVPAKMLLPSDIPDKWGLIYAFENCTRLVKKPQAFDERYREGEMNLLVSVIRRIGNLTPRGVQVNAYYYDGVRHCNSTVHIETLEESDGKDNS